MLLAVDVGNTQTVLGLYDNKTLTHMWRVSTNKTQTSDELGVVVRSLFEGEQITVQAITGTALASVVPQLTNAWVELAENMFDLQALVVDAYTARPLFKTTYENLAEIGPDRVADAVAAEALYGAPVVVVDFGTATNIEVIDKEGRFIGGIIAPGLTTSANALFSSATRLSAIDFEEPAHAIGPNTKEAIQSGIIFGEVERVDGLVRRIFAQLGYKTPVIATGGLSEGIVELCSTVTKTNLELTLEGLRLIYERHN